MATELHSCWKTHHARSDRRRVGRGDASPEKKLEATPDSAVTTTKRHTFGLASEGSFTSSVRELRLTVSSLPSALKGRATSMPTEGYEYLGRVAQRGADYGPYSIDRLAAPLPPAAA